MGKKLYLKNYIYFLNKRKSRNRSQRKGAQTFNEELKSFIEKVVQSGKL